MPDPAFPFHFLRPVWLWLLVPAFVVAALARRAADPSKRWGAIITPPLLEKLLIRRKSKWRFRPIHGLIIALVLGALGIAGPTWHREKPPFTEDKAPLVIALDLSRDMDAIDVQPTRLERAKLKILDLMKARQGARTALFVYSSSAHMVLPLTSDESLVALYAESLSTDLLPSGARDTVSALRSIDHFLRNETIPGTILFITPGIERRAFPAFEQHRDTAQNQVLVLAIGTPAGGPIRTASGQFASDAGRRIFSKLDVAGLRALKQQAGVPVGSVTLNDDDVKW
ncbi:MAG TPA: VWA domain-containing protein, partial [Bryobacteraceae bacterium]